MDEKIRIGLFDDHAFFLNGLIDFLGKHPDTFSLMFTSTTREELRRQLAMGEPDVLIMDVLAPDVTGLDLYVETLKEHEQLKILSYTSLRSEILIESLLNLGVKGYVNKNQPAEDLLEAIREVSYGLTAVPDTYRDLIPDEQQRVKNIFTKREYEILILLAKGATSDMIANELKVSLRTIENLKVTLFKKIGVKNSAELILAATRLGYLS